MRWGSTEAHADRGTEAAGSATVFDATDLASSMLDYDEVLAVLDEDDEWHAARSWDRLADADDRVRRPLGRVS